MRISWPIAVGAFAAGLVTGLLMAPKAGHETRRELASKARARLHELEEQLHGIETHLRRLERQLQALGERFLQTTESEAWQLENKDIARELPRLPHG